MDTVVSILLGIGSIVMLEIRPRTLVGPNVDHLLGLVYTSCAVQGKTFVGSIQSSVFKKRGLDRIGRSKKL